MKEEYYVYCDGILGVKTDIRNFRWVYGSDAEAASGEEYEKCAVKFSVCLKKEPGEVKTYDKKFQSFLWEEKTKTVHYRRTLFSKLKLGYDITFNNDSVDVVVGKNYFKYVKLRMMNMHAVYYLLSDIANMLLLKKGYHTLYASAVCSKEKDRGIVFFSPPNTGKTLTATTLSREYPYSMIGEDIVITDGKKLYSCPWTSSYRKKSSAEDSAGSFGRTKNKPDCEKSAEGELADVVVLSLGKEKKITSDKNELLNQILILNGYLFNYLTSPIIKVLGYFDMDFSADWNTASTDALKAVFSEKNCSGIQAQKSPELPELVCKLLTGDAE